MIKSTKKFWGLINDVTFAWMDANFAETFFIKIQDASKVTAL